MKLWKRNVVVAAIVLFVCVAVYLNWSYNREDDTADAGKTLGEAALVGNQTSDPLVSTTPDPAASPTPSAEPDSTGTGYFASARLNRQQARDSALSLLQEAAASEDADQAMKDEANASIQTMASLTVSEAQIENLVTAKGYADCVAFMGEDSISVVVDTGTGELTAEDVAKITDIAMTETGYPASGIKIMASN